MGNSNTERIMRDAIANGIYTQEQVDMFLSAGKTPPIHTSETWRRLGFRVKEQESPRLCTKLWQYAENDTLPDNSGKEESGGHFYLTKAYLYTSDQVERYLEVTK
ncbi:MAG: hypothetical protein LUE14_08605 [Clostridiales bacterium]|nr:hypothetical protein [Clostridiales bacterium]